MPYGHYLQPNSRGENSFKLDPEWFNLLDPESLPFLDGRGLSYDHLWNIGGKWQQVRE